MRAPRTRLRVALGLVSVVLGLLVLRSPGAQVAIGWFSYGGPPSPALLAGLVGWNLTRAAGALLVLAGLLVLAHLLGVLAGSRGGRAPALPGVAVLVLAGVLVVGGLVAFVAADLLRSSEGNPAHQLGVDGSVWTRGQLSGALVVATGLVLGAVGAGLRRSSVPPVRRGSVTSGEPVVGPGSNVSKGPDAP